MKEIKKMKIDKLKIMNFKISEYTTNQLFDINVDKCDKVVTSVS